MKYFQPMIIERFIYVLVNNDREISKICSNWEMEKDDITKVILDHYTDMGIFMVYPLTHATMMRNDVINFLLHSKEIKVRREVIQREIAKAREKNRARGIN